jgi:hypothetical protein
VFVCHLPSRVTEGPIEAILVPLSISRRIDLEAAALRVLGSCSEMDLVSLRTKSLPHREARKTELRVEASRF